LRCRHETMLRVSLGSNQALDVFTVAAAGACTFLRGGRIIRTASLPWARCKSLVALFLNQAATTWTLFNYLSPSQTSGEAAGLRGFFIGCWWRDLPGRGVSAR